MLLTACLFCWGCQEVPEWPESGIADAAWVETAVAWRLQTGIDACGETGKAVDALTLEWIAASPKVRVEITTNEWPVLRHYPELKTPLIQALAWGELQGVEWEKEALVKLLRKVVRKSDGLKSSRVRPVPHADANTNVVMEAMNIKMAKARYRSGIAFMRPFTGASGMRLHLKGFFGTNSNKSAA